MSGQFRADVHVKTHGYADVEFRVLPNLPEELAQGLFEHDGIYPAVVRFSNAASQPQTNQPSVKKRTVLDIRRRSARLRGAMHLGFSGIRRVAMNAALRKNGL
jgi:hypothetical protein